MNILGIETSCDETAISIYNSKKGIILNKIYSQIKIHSKYGGIVPEIASINHAKKIIPLIKYTFNKFKKKKIKAIAYTAGPGLSSSLLIGATAAITLSFLYKIDNLPINHIEGHIMSIMLCKKKPLFPFLSLVISGAHTYLIIIFNYFKYKIIGQTLDDSSGEVLDKISNLLGYKYPGGEKIYNLAKLSKNNLNFPKPLINKKNFNFSFSGLKTHITKLIKKNINFKSKCDIAYSLQKSIVTILIKKTKQALINFNLKAIAMVGGVSANNNLRKKMCKMTKKLKKKTFFPPKKLCTDNAAMIAYVGYIKYIKKKKKLLNNFKIHIKSNWNIKSKL